MDNTILLNGENYRIICSHCGGRAVVIEKPTDDTCLDGEFLCRGDIDCQFCGPGEEFSFERIK